MSSLKDICWMASPLAIEQRMSFNEKGSKIHGIRIPKPSERVARYLDPKNEIHVFRKIEHWTLEIDGWCYELSPDTKKKLHMIKKVTDSIKPHWIDAKKWFEMRDAKEITPEKRKIGQTRKTHDEIQAAVDDIWKNFNKDWYGFFTQNCQNFAHMLFERVAVETPDGGNGIWEKIPEPVGYALADGSRVALAGKAAHGIKATLAVAKAAPAAQASQGVGAVGSMGATTSGSAATGGTAMAGGSTASGIAAAGSTTGTLAATGCTAGSTTTAGGGAVTAGHVGLGAKAAALMHGGSHAAALGSSGMAKAGVAVAFAHPVTGIAMTGGLAYLAIRGKRSKGWNKKHMQKKPEDMDVLDMLEVEDEAFDRAGGDPDKVVEELNAEMNDGELADDLHLGLVTTEPATLSEDHEAVPAVQDERRTQTTV